MLCEYIALDGTSYLYEWENSLLKQFESKKDGEVNKKVFDYDGFEISSIEYLSSYSLFGEY